MFLDHYHKVVEKMRGGINFITYPVQVIVATPFDVGGWLLTQLSTRQSLIAENKSLRAQNSLIKAQLQKMAALEVENIRLRSLLDSTFRIADKVFIAEIIEVDLEPFTQRIVINKGSKDNTEDVETVYEGQAIIDSEGIVGQIVQVKTFSSTAMLVTDPNSSIPVQVNRNGLRAIANGNGSINQLELVHVPNNADIKPGDILVSSGLGGKFPTNYPVAVVTKVLPDPSAPYATVYARPLAKLAQIRNVLLVKPQEQNIQKPRTINRMLPTDSVLQGNDLDMNGQTLLNDTPENTSETDNPGDDDQAQTAMENAPGNPAANAETQVSDSDNQRTNNRENVSNPGNDDNGTISDDSNRTQ